MNQSPNQQTQPLHSSPGKPPPSPGFIAAAMAENARPNVPPIVPRLASKNDGGKGKRPSDSAVASKAKKPTKSVVRKDDPAYLLAGLDGGGKPHASCFARADHLRALDASRGTSMLLVEVDSAELLTLAKQLPVGKIHASGKAFVPFVKADLFKQLVALVPAIAQKDLISPNSSVQVEC